MSSGAETVSVASPICSERASAADEMVTDAPEPMVAAVASSGTPALQLPASAQSLSTAPVQVVALSAPKTHPVLPPRSREAAATSVLAVAVELETSTREMLAMPSERNCHVPAAVAGRRESGASAEAPVSESETVAVSEAPFAKVSAVATPGAQDSVRVVAVPETAMPSADVLEKTRAWKAVAPGVKLCAAVPSRTTVEEAQVKLPCERSRSPPKVSVSVPEGSPPGPA